MKDRLPIEAHYMIRYHSFYSWHREGEYQLDVRRRGSHDDEVGAGFNRYDLYSKDEEARTSTSSGPSTKTSPRSSSPNR